MLQDEGKICLIFAPLYYCLYVGKLSGFGVVDVSLVLLYYISVFSCSLCVCISESAMLSAYTRRGKKEKEKKKKKVPAIIYDHTILQVRTVSFRSSLHAHLTHRQETQTNIYEACVRVMTRWPLTSLCISLFYRGKCRPCIIKAT